MIHSKNKKIDLYCLEGNIFCTCYRNDNPNFTFYNNKYKKWLVNFIE